MGVKVPLFVSNRNAIALSTEPANFTYTYVSYQMNGKYSPLYDHIRRLDAKGVREWHASHASFDEID